MRQYITLLLCLIGMHLHSQQFVTDFHGIRAMRMAYAYTNIVGIQASYNNPSGLSFLEDFEITLGMENRYEIPELSTFHIAFAAPYQKLGTFGFHLMQFGTDIYINQKVGLTYARKLFDKLHLGIQFDYMHTRIQQYGQQSNLTFEIGLMSDINDHLNIAVHIFSPYGLLFSESRVIPSIMTLGVCYKLSEQVKLIAEVEKNTYQIPRLKVVALYGINKHFSCSLGVFSDSESANICSGILLSLNKRFKMDLGICFHQYLGLSSGISLDYSF